MPGPEIRFTVVGYVNHQDEYQDVTGRCPQKKRVKIPFNPRRIGKYNLIDLNASCAGCNEYSGLPHIISVSTPDLNEVPTGGRVKVEFKIECETPEN